MVITENDCFRALSLARRGSMTARFTRALFDFVCGEEGIDIEIARAVCHNSSIIFEACGYDREIGVEMVVRFAHCFVIIIFFVCGL